MTRAVPVIGAGAVFQSPSHGRGPATVKRPPLTKGMLAAVRGVNVFV